MAIPAWKAKGTFASGTGALSVAWPTSGSYAVGDLALLICESANQAHTTPSGWTPVANSPQFTGTAAAAGGVRLSVFYKYATSTSETNVSVADTGNHTTGQIHVFKACVIETTIGGVRTPAGTSITFGSLTTANDNDLIVFCLANDRDAASTANLSAWTNANLTGLTERHDQTVTSGVGGGIGVASGVMASAGAIGTTTVTNAASVTAAWLVIALRQSVFDESTEETTASGEASDYAWEAGGTTHDVDCPETLGAADDTTQSLATSTSTSQSASGNHTSGATTLATALSQEVGTAIDLPAGQYTAINDAAETALGVDAPVGSYTTTSARTEAGSAGSADDVDQSTGVSGVALGTASEAASNIASITAARSESGISVETQAGSMNTTKTQAEVGNLSEAGLSTMVTTGASVEAVVAIDSLSQTVTTAVSLLAGLTATEAQVTIYSFSVADLEGALADADQSGSANFASTRGEGTTALEASMGSANLGTTLTEAIPATEESGYQTNVLNLSRTEASPLVDVPSSVMVAFAQITGVGTLAEVVQGSNTTQSSNLEALVSAAIQAGVMNWLSQAAESVTSGGTLNSNVSTNTTATEAVTANTYADNGGATTAVAQEPAPSWDDPQGTAVSLISRTEPAAAVDFSSQGATTQAASTEAAAPSESASTLVAGAAATTATGAATDLPGATHSGFATSQELAAAADQINAGLLTILSTIAAAVGGDVSTAVGSIDLTLVDVAQATEGTAELVAFTGTLLEVVTLGDDYLCTLVSDITLDEQATAVTLQLDDLNVILDVLKLQNVFLVSREVRGHRIGMDLRDLVVEIERRGFDVPQDIREIAVAIERRSYNVTK